MRPRPLLIGLGVFAGSLLVAAVAPAINLSKQEVEFENQQVRVVRLHYEPLATTGMHDDPDRVVIPLSPLDFVETFANGGSAEIQKAADDPFWNPAARHSIDSESARPVEAVEVDFIGSEEDFVHASPPHPSPADANHFRIVLDEPRARVLAVHFGPHEKSNLLKHTDGVLVALTEAHLTAAGSSPAARRFDLLRGEAAWWPAGTDAVENPSGAPCDLVWVELKHVSFSPSPSGDLSAANGAPDSDSSSSSSLEVLTSTSGVDFQPYLARAIGKMRRNWYAVMPDEARRGEKGKVVLEFEIRSDGKISEPSVVSNSGNGEFLRAAQSAVRSSSPLEPLPPGFHGPAVKLRFTFLYNLKP